jgi:hypothetical protein
MRPWAVLLVLACWSGAAHARDGRTIYGEYCAACHGADGRGGAAREASFPVDPPDFTDCRFTTPEPNSDWFASIHEGGPARGFDRRMPAFDQVLSDADIVAVVGYLRRFCREPGWPRGEFNLPRPFFVEKAFPEDEAIVRVDGSRSEVTTTVFYERRFGARWQLEVVVPVVNAEQMTGGWAGGIGDIAFAVKRVLVAGASTIVSGAVEVSTPTGRFDRGFGAGTTMIEGSVMAAQLLPHHAFVQLQAGAAVAYDRSFPDEAFGRIALGDSVVPVRHGRLFAPMVEVIAARELASDAVTEVDVVPELQVTLSARQHIRAAAGVQVPVTERSRDPVGLVYVLWDIADGGVLEGW